MDFDNLESAVRFAAESTREIFGNEREAIALVYEKDGRFHVTEPISERESSERVKGAFKIPKDSLRFVVHNHPAGRGEHLFSDNDIRNSDRLGVPSAIIFGKEPQIRVYTPGVTKTTTVPTGPRQRQKASLGDEFGEARQ